MNNLTDENDEHDDYIFHFDQIDFDNYGFGTMKSLGGAFEVPVHSIEPSSSGEPCQFCLPSFRISQNGLPLETTTSKKNQVIEFVIDPDNSEHVELTEWFETFDNWVIQEIIYNHPKWFGHFWEKGGRMEGKPKPPPEILASMFEHNFDGTTFSLRVPMRDNIPQIETFDIEHTTIPLESIKNCDIIPIIEFKSIRLYSKKSCYDIVLRGICAQCTYEEIGVDYQICAPEEKTEDEDADDIGTDDEDYENYENSNHEEETDDDDDDDDNDDDGNDDDNVQENTEDNTHLNENQGEQVNDETLETKSIDGIQKEYDNFIDNSHSYDGNDEDDEVQESDEDDEMREVEPAYCQSMNSFENLDINDL